MRRLAALLLALHPVVTEAQEGWWLTASRPDGAMLYHCGDLCRDEKLVCVHFSQPGPDRLKVQDLVDEMLVPWGQIDFSTASAVLEDRDLVGVSDISGGGRLEGPQIIAFDGSDWATARYGFETLAGEAVNIDLLLWPDGTKLQGLRCSYRAGTNAVPLIQDLAGSLR